MFLTTEQVLVAYIKTGMKPLRGKSAWAVDADGNDLRDSPFRCTQGEVAAACPIGVLCMVKGVDPRGIESGTFGEHYYANNHDGNICWVDGFVAGWEETEYGKGYDPKAHDYTPENNPEGLEIYDRGYKNGQHIRQEFIRLGLRSE